jgi:hypothetical protein
MPETLHQPAADPGIDPSAQPRKEYAGREDRPLEEKARQFGNSLGKAVAFLREARYRLQRIAGQTRDLAAARNATLKTQPDQTDTHFGDIAGDVGRSVRTKNRQWSQAVSSVAADLCRTTAEKMNAVSSQIRMKYYRARRRGNQVVREYPVHVVFAAGLAGFLAGVGLRMWRSKHE